MTPSGLASKVIHARKGRRRSSTGEVAGQSESPALTAGRRELDDSLYVDVPLRVAEKLVASGEEEAIDA